MKFFYTKTPKILLAAALWLSSGKSNAEDATYPTTPENATLVVKIQETTNNPKYRTKTLATFTGTGIGYGRQVITTASPFNSHWKNDGSVCVIIEKPETKKAWLGKVLFYVHGANMDIGKGIYNLALIEITAGSDNSVVPWVWWENDDPDYPYLSIYGYQDGELMGSKQVKYFGSNLTNSFEIDKDISASLEGSGIFSGGNLIGVANAVNTKTDRTIAHPIRVVHNVFKTQCQTGQCYQPNAYMAPRIRSGNPNVMPRPGPIIHEPLSQPRPQQPQPQPSLGPSDPPSDLVQVPATIKPLVTPVDREVPTPVIEQGTPTDPPGIDKPLTSVVVKRDDGDEPELSTGNSDASQAGTIIAEFIERLQRIEDCACDKESKKELEEISDILDRIEENTRGRIPGSGNDSGTDNSSGGNNTGRPREEQPREYPPRDPGPISRPPHTVPDRRLDDCKEELARLQIALNRANKQIIYVTADGCKDCLETDRMVERLQEDGYPIRMVRFNTFFPSRIQARYRDIPRLAIFPGGMQLRGEREVKDYLVNVSNR